MGAIENPGDLPEPYNPIGKAQTLAQWRKRMRMPVANRLNVIVNLTIVAIDENTVVNGRLVDALITTDNAKVRFGVIFSKLPPSRHDFGIPILWREDGVAGLGRWVGVSTITVSIPLGATLTLQQVKASGLSDAAVAFLFEELGSRMAEPGKHTIELPLELEAQGKAIAAAMQGKEP